ncbi:hypothetical protein [Schlesneria paludicola]|uniref:hypothetical protein n=1 Tax=Schlesneria paludicola TaxID=360056 RepID=UPI00029AE778|nr:hypothetical protein [Schlesneria paludicola]
MSNNAIRLTQAPIAPSARRFGVPVKLLFRAGVTLFLIVVAVMAADWFQRRGVWSVVMAGGTVSSIRRADSLKYGVSNATSGDLNPTISELFEDVRNGWFPPDDCVFGVNLSHAAVGQECLPRMASMPSLEFLALDARQIGPELAQLGRLPNFRQLKVHGPDEQTLFRNLLTLPHLEQLQIVNPRGIARDFAELGRHPVLRQLEFEALDSTADDWARLLEQCHDWPHLEIVLIRSQFSLSPGLQALQSCPSLTTLELSAPLCHRDLAAIAEIRQLTKLVLNAKKLQGTDLLQLGSLSKMRTLKIYSHGDHESALEELRRLLPNCEIDSTP